MNYVKYLLQCLQKRGFDKTAEDQVLDLATPTSDVSPVFKRSKYIMAHLKILSTPNEFYFVQNATILPIP